MPAISVQQVLRLPQRRHDIETGHRPRRASRQFVRGRRQQHTGQGKFFRQAAGHDADDAAMPFVMMQDQRGIFQQMRFGFDLADGGGIHLVGQESPAGVGVFQAASQARGAVDVVGGQQLDSRVGVFNSAQGVQAWRDGKTDVPFVERGGVNLSALQDGANARTRIRPQLRQPELQQVAVFAQQRHDIGDHAQRNQIDMRGGDFWFQRLDEFVGDADAGQIAQGVSFWQAARIYDSQRSRQPLWQSMMVGDDGIDALLRSQLGRSVRVNARIAGQQQVKAIFQVALQGRRMNAMPFAESIGQMRRDARAQLAQRSIEQRGSCLSIDIEVAPDQDALSLADGFSQARHSRFDIGQVAGGRWRVLRGIQELSGSGRIADAHARQSPGHDRMSANGRSERGGRLGLRRELPGAGQGCHRLASQRADPGHVAWSARPCCLCPQDMRGLRIQQLALWNPKMPGQPC